MTRRERAPCFEIGGLTKIYGEGEAAVAALRGIDLTIGDGELVVLLGPSGSGKSTFLNILGGLDAPSAGHVRFHGADITKFDDRDLTRWRRDSVGFIFQSYNLMPGLTADENVRLVTEIAADPMPVSEALEAVGLAKRGKHFPSELSGGEQQRVAIARAIAKRPKVLLCDEPTGALDSATSRRVLEVLVDVARREQATVIMVTHHQGIAPIADRVIRFRDGQVEEDVRNDNPLTTAEITL